MQQGSHVPMLMVEGDQKTVMMPIPEMADTHEGRAQQLFLAGMVLASSGEVGVLQQVFFITEGWLSVVEGRKLPDRPPSQDPQRIEVLTVSGVSLPTGETKITLLEMKRDRAGELETLEPLEGCLNAPEMTQAESPLLNAFVLGFLGLAQEVDD